ncbi:helix-turn-helix transcriptional regulator [Rhodococcus sp. X156]|uniref:helix-turn-helix domain-containing protein n=1 Tax=Rhodococcus sp. X156 TaxID=2499145 RepID=UPI0013E29193|nr:helix-turn-helix transcriptional regulator [Rhodococcus sp. X156]
MSEFNKALGGRLREVRKGLGLSLQAVQEKSDGQWKAVVVGSYERGDRGLTMIRLAALARFYGVGVAELIPELRADAKPVRLVLNVDRVRQLTQEQAQPVRQHVETVLHRRGGTSTLLEMRAADLDVLASANNTTGAQLLNQLADWGCCARA